MGNLYESREMFFILFMKGIGRIIKIELHLMI